jgi:hypothetical protein
MAHGAGTHKRERSVKDAKGADSTRLVNLARAVLATLSARLESVRTGARTVDCEDVIAIAR